MASDATISALLGASVDDNNIPPSNAKSVARPTQIGDGLAGPRNVQHLVIFRDARPIATDELAFQASLGSQVIARHRAGRYFILNRDFQVGGAGLDGELPGMPLESGLPGASRQDALNRGKYKQGLRPQEVLAPAQTVYYTATPQVGYDW